MTSREVMHLGDLRDFDVILDAMLNVAPSTGAMHRVLAGYGMSEKDYRFAFGDSIGT